MKGGIGLRRKISAFGRTDRSKISSDQKRLFFAVSQYYPLSFFANTTFNSDIHLQGIQVFIYKVFIIQIFIFRVFYNLQIHLHFMSFTKKINLHLSKPCKVYVLLFVKMKRNKSFSVKHDYYSIREVQIIFPTLL